MRNKTAYKAYSQGAQHGKFGDHKSQGGKVVKGVSGKIHIQDGLETDIMKTHGPEGEYILAQKNGYQSIDDVPVNETTGNKEYFLGTIALAWGLGTKKGRKWSDKNISDPLQKLFKIGEYSDIGQSTKQLKEMMGTSTENVIEGQKKTEEFITENLQSDLEGFGRQEDRLDTQIIGSQMAMGDQYQASQNIQTKTGLVGNDNNRRKIERQGTMQMETLGSTREDIFAAGDKARTQADMDIYRSKKDTQTALGQIFSDYMAATGETISDENMNLLQDYMADNDVASIEELEQGDIDNGY